MFEVEKKNVTSGDGTEYLRYSISGSIDIESVAALKSLILEGFNACDHLVLDWYAVEDVDFSALQLMCATNLYAYEQNKTFELKNRFIPPVLEAADQLGFMRETGCPKENRNHCLWLKP
ncbi:MAG: STAS domain-containing protein [Thermodesulfobacteriota bacterium]